MPVSEHPTCARCGGVFCIRLCALAHAVSCLRTRLPNRSAREVHTDAHPNKEVNQHHNPIM